MTGNLETHSAIEDMDVIDDKTITKDGRALLCLDHDILSDGKKQWRPVLWIVEDEKHVESTLKQLRATLPRVYQVITLPSFDCRPYDRLSPSPQVMSQRVKSLLTIYEAYLDPSEASPLCVVLSLASFMQRVPPLEGIYATMLRLKKGENLGRENLFKHFQMLGFQKNDVVRMVGDYAFRGSIVDCFSPTCPSPVRLDFFGDTVESIKTFDVFTQQSKDFVEDLHFIPVSELLLNEKTIAQFRVAFRSHAASVDVPLYQALSQGRSFSGMEHFLPLFYPMMTLIDAYLDHPIVTGDGAIFDKAKTFLEAIKDTYHERKQTSPGDRPYYPLPPHLLYRTEEDFAHLKHIQSDPFVAALNGIDHAKVMGLSSLIATLKEKSHEKAIIIGCKSEGARERIHHLLKENGLDYHALDSVSHHMSFGLYTLLYPLEEGFEHAIGVFVPDHFFIGKGTPHHFQKRTMERFFKEINTYNTGDFLVHRHHGIGKYLGLETVSVDALLHDCLVLGYAEEAKLFLPVENMDLLTSFARSDALVEVDRLGSTAWKNRKEKAKKKLLEVAHYLLEVAAKRHMKKGHAFLMDEPSDRLLYAQFSKGFPYVETDDQARAILDVENDLASGKPMDRLICGDVGFGKTEVALRAAFLVASKGAQVIVIVPTTLLARQHYAHFQKRCKDFNLRVEMLCRLVKPKKTEDIRREVREGGVNILIATHAAFSDKLHFHNLGLVIVDEEHHFGVKQKERLKLLRADVHVLTLTATPIPRTLQMSLTGLREMSLITTPPHDRLPIRTFVLEQDFSLLREVILREHQRGGQIFVVTPRLEDLPKLLDTLKKAVPHLRIDVAHGQMNATELENVVQKFYDHDFDILLCTNIIESGIDIPNANTMIVHKAHLFGLAQLYQMRGRIGRGKRQSYAYLTVPKDQHLGENALKRLQILQSLDTLGAGFNLASHDLDLRGAGNIVGEEQSGHVRDVGVELYQHMLQEALATLKAERQTTAKNTEDMPISKDDQIVDFEFSPTLNLGVSVLLPEAYIRDLGLRLSLYKRASNLHEKEAIHAFAIELVDRFGPLPKEAQQFLKILELKDLCYRASIEKIDAGAKGIVIQFYQNTPPNFEKLMAYLQKNANILRLRPDGKLVLSGNLESTEKRLSLTEKLCTTLAQMMEKKS